MKFSKQRELILTTVLENNVHPTAEFIYDTLKKDNPSLSLGTVYRNLSVLENEGLIKKVKIAGHPDRYDGVLNYHLHFVCKKCGNIIDIESPVMEELEKEISKEVDGEVEDATIILYGRCSRCKENNF